MSRALRSGPPTTRASFFVTKQYSDGNDDAVEVTPSYDNGSLVSDVSCAYVDVTSGEFSCDITNNADPATFTVIKDWIIDGVVGDAVDLSASLTIQCDGRVIQAIDGEPLNNFTDSVTTTLEGDGDSVTVTLNTAQGPASCQASEEISQSGVESEDNCGSRSIPAGGSSSCTITNSLASVSCPRACRCGSPLAPGAVWAVQPAWLRSGL